MSKIPLGKPSGYPQKYNPEVLFGVPRTDARADLGIGLDLPFGGEDIWNAWELTWLDISGKPIVATATIRVPAESDKIIESKSLKLYLNSFAMVRYESRDSVVQLITSDLVDVTRAPVSVMISTAGHSTTDRIAVLPGTCIDDHQADFSASVVDSDLLKCGGKTVTEELHSHLLRSNCPVTNQPDSGSVLIRYQGPQIDRASLLQYLVSFRQHNDFHEACVERIFVDLKAHCQPQRLTVYARYNRRGGIDINPFRSDFEERAENLRLWRQ